MKPPLLIDAVDPWQDGAWSPSCLQVRPEPIEGRVKRSNKKENLGFLNETKQGCWGTETCSVTDNAPSLLSARRLEQQQRLTFSKDVFDLAVSGDFGRQVLDAPSAAALAKDVAVQWVTASVLPLRGQQEPAFLVDTHSSQFNATVPSLWYETGSGFVLTSQT